MAFRYGSPNFRSVPRGSQVSRRRSASWHKQFLHHPFNRLLLSLTGPCTLQLGQQMESFGVELGPGYVCAAHRSLSLTPANRRSPPLRGGSSMRWFGIGNLMGRGRTGLVVDVDPNTVYRVVVRQQFGTTTTHSTGTTSDVL